MNASNPLQALETNFTDDMADQLRPLIEQAEQGDYWATWPIRLILAVTPRLWDRHPVLAMRAERACLVASAEQVLDKSRRMRSCLPSTS